MGRIFCCANDCHNTSISVVDGKKVKLHRFPANKAIARVWLFRVCRKDLKLKTTTRLCSQHFKDGEKTDVVNLPTIFTHKIFKLHKYGGSLSDGACLASTSEIPVKAELPANLPAADHHLEQSWRMHDYNGRINVCSEHFRFRQGPRKDDSIPSIFPQKIFATSYIAESHNQVDIVDNDSYRNTSFKVSADAPNLYVSVQLHDYCGLSHEHVFTIPPQPTKLSQEHAFTITLQPKKKRRKILNDCDEIDYLLRTKSCQTMPVLVNDESSQTERCIIPHMDVTNEPCEISSAQVVETRTRFPENEQDMDLLDMTCESAVGVNDKETNTTGPLLRNSFAQTIVLSHDLDAYFESASSKGPLVRNSFAQTIVLSHDLDAYFDIVIVKPTIDLDKKCYYQDHEEEQNRFNNHLIDVSFVNEKVPSLVESASLLPDMIHTKIVQSSTSKSEQRTTQTEEQFIGRPTFVDYGLSETNYSPALPRPVLDASTQISHTLTSHMPAVVKTTHPKAPALPHPVSDASTQISNTLTSHMPAVVKTTHPKAPAMPHPVSDASTQISNTLTSDMPAVVKTTHSKANACICDRCGMTFSNLQCLKQHVVFHNKSFPFHCAICGKGMAAKYKLRIHEKTHSGAKPFVCDLCNRHFTVKSSVYSHLRLHTGEKPYGCPCCDMTFCQPVSRSSHLISVHNYQPKRFSRPRKLFKI